MRDLLVCFLADKAPAAPRRPPVFFQRVHRPFAAKFMHSSAKHMNRKKPRIDPRESLVSYDERCMHRANAYLCEARCDRYFGKLKAADLTTA